MPLSHSEGRCHAIHSLNFLTKVQPGPTHSITKRPSSTLQRFSFIAASHKHNDSHVHSKIWVQPIFVCVVYTGDVNFFRNDPEEDPGVVELEVMVAEQSSRRKGLACEALQMFMAYAHSKLAVHTFRVKIGDDNLPSLKLFGRLGFVQIGHSHIFEETELELSTKIVDGLQNELVKTLHQQAADLQYGDYDQLVQEPL